MKVEVYLKPPGERARTYKVEAKPCPCCGNENLDIGVQAAMTMGIRCARYPITGPGGCGLRITREYPEYRPKNCKTCYAMEKMLIEECLKVWNTRFV